MTPSSYGELLRIASRHTRRADEAQDLVQDALLEAVSAGRADLGDTANRRWLAGVIRNRAAFLARGAARRKRREAQWQLNRPADEDEGLSVEEVLTGLPPSLKAVAALALTGHSRREIGYLLRLSDTALRQRLSALRRHLVARGISMPTMTPGLGLALNYGRIRDALLPKLLHEGGLFASHDPDGHLFVIRRSQIATERQQQGGTDQRRPK